MKGTFADDKNLKVRGFSTIMKAKTYPHLLFRTVYLRKVQGLCHN
jgi:hypothetical protein